MSASKTLVIVNGAMGVGKTTVCNLLLEQLQPAAYLDADWCWNIKPFLTTAENLAMVHSNITHVLRSYLRHSEISTVILSWVMHKEQIFRAVVDPLADLKFRTTTVTLTMSPDSLRKRLEAEVTLGRREASTIELSLQRLAECQALDTVKVDASASPREVARLVASCLTVQ
jgi:adenylate kinase family enzyme